MSPEQVQGENDIDGRSDIYSLGVILFQVLTGQVPYHGDTAARVMMMHILEPVPHITAVSSTIPSAFDAVIEKSMAKDPNDRYNNTIEMAHSVVMAARGSNMPTLVGEQALDFSNLETNLNPASAASAPTFPLQDRAQDGRPHPGLPVSPPAVALAGSAAAVLTPGVRPIRRIPSWVWIAGALALVGILVAAFTLGGGMHFIGSSLNPTLTASSTVPIVAAATPIPSDTATPTTTPSNTPTPTSLPTETPTATSTPLPPTDTPTPLPLAPVIGGADKLAFISNNEVYIVNLDGTDLAQLTFDGGAKSGLSWTPDGSALAYITGLCIKMVDIETTRIDELLCFEYASSLDGFEISPDSQQLAIVINH